MKNGDIDRIAWRRRVLTGALALGVAGALAACTTAADKGGDAPAAAASTPAAKYFGPASFGKLTVTMTEQEALASGELRTSPVATVQGKNVELKAAYADQGLKSSSKTAYELPAAGHPGWTVLFELQGETVRYMSIGKAG